jgi:pentatricopeptide repeat protein
MLRLLRRVPLGIVSRRTCLSTAVSPSQNFSRIELIHSDLFDKVYDLSSALNKEQYKQLYELLGDISDESLKEIVVAEAETSSSQAKSRGNKREGRSFLCRVFDTFLQVKTPQALHRAKFIIDLSLREHPALASQLRARRLVHYCRDYAMMQLNEEDYYGNENEYNVGNKHERDQKVKEVLFQHMAGWLFHNQSSIENYKLVTRALFALARHQDSIRFHNVDGNAQFALEFIEYMKNYLAAHSTSGEEDYKHLIGDIVLWTYHTFRLQKTWFPNEPQDQGERFLQASFGKGLMHPTYFKSDSFALAVTGCFGADQNRVSSIDDHTFYTSTLQPAIVDNQDNSSERKENRDGSIGKISHRNDGVEVDRMSLDYLLAIVSMSNDPLIMKLREKVIEVVKVRGPPELVIDLIDRLKQPDTSADKGDESSILIGSRIYNALLGAYAELGMSDKVMSTLDDMFREEQIVEKMTGKGINKTSFGQNKYSFVSIWSGYGKTIDRYYEYVNAVFASRGDSMKAKTRSNATIKGLMKELQRYQSDRYDLSLSLLQKMDVNLDTWQFSPDMRSLLNIAVYAKKKQDFETMKLLLRLGHELCKVPIKKMSEDETEVDDSQSTTLRGKTSKGNVLITTTVSDIGSDDDSNDASRLDDKSTEKIDSWPSTIPSNKDMTALYTLAIQTAISLKNQDDVLLLLSYMVNSGLKPDPKLMRDIMRVTFENEGYEDVLHIFGLMRSWDIDRNASHAEILVKSFAMLGRLKDALVGLAHLKQDGTNEEQIPSTNSNNNDHHERHAIGPGIYVINIKQLCRHIRSAEDKRRRNHSHSTVIEENEDQMTISEMEDAVADLITFTLGSYKVKTRKGNSKLNLNHTLMKYLKLVHYRNRQNILRKMSKHINDVQNEKPQQTSQLQKVENFIEIARASKSSREQH